MDQIRHEHIKRFYDCLSVLERACGGTRLLENCNGQQDWPRRGVYFILEPGEMRTDSGKGSRVVRIGTHGLRPGSSASLWKRISQHRGTLRSGGGNCRGSVFRRIVGSALIALDGHFCLTWDDGRSTASAATRAGERALENEVSKVIGAMRVLWLAIDDEPGPESERGTIERNAIALLSNYNKVPIDTPSASWLGHHCSRERVRVCGLWNSDHVGEQYNPVFLDRMQDLIERAVKK